MKKITTLLKQILYAHYVGSLSDGCRRDRRMAKRIIAKERKVRRPDYILA